MTCFYRSNRPSRALKRAIAIEACTDPALTDAEQQLLRAFFVWGETGNPAIRAELPFRWIAVQQERLREAA